MLLFLPYLLMSCKGKEAEKAAGEQALTTFREYVTGFAQDSLSEIELDTILQTKNDSMAWERAKANLLQEYESLHQHLQKHQEHLSPAQHKEAAQLDQTYHNALKARQHQYQDASHRLKLRRELLDTEVKEDDLRGVTADNIGLTFQRFATGVQRHAASYQSRDWQLIEGWWSTLNSRYRELEKSLPERVKKTVSQAQEKYKEVQPKEEAGGQETQEPQP